MNKIELLHMCQEQHNYLMHTNINFQVKFFLEKSWEREIFFCNNNYINDHFESVLDEIWIMFPVVVMIFCLNFIIKIQIQWKTFVLLYFILSYFHKSSSKSQEFKGKCFVNLATTFIYIIYWELGSLIDFN